MSLTILKFGWEFYPYHSGGLGVACQGLVQGLIDHGIRITLVLPFVLEKNSITCKTLATSYDNVLTIKRIDSALIPYATSASYHKDQQLNQDERGLYGKNIFAEVARYADVALELIRNEHFDIIHAHDWLSIPAGIAAKLISGKPFIVHIHATEFERTGGNGLHQSVYDIEKKGMEFADKIIAVSNVTKNTIIQQYGISPGKIEVVHNGIWHSNNSNHSAIAKSNQNPVVLFLGRLTLQKGPDYFVAAAKRVLEYRPNTTFVIAGTGDMQLQLIKTVTNLGIADKVLFTGFLRGSEVKRMLHLADLLVMPSVAEPFGLVALEAIDQHVPIIISKTAGVGEVVSHCLKIDFYDVDELACKIIAILDNPVLGQELRLNAHREIGSLSWHEASKKCINIYRQIAGFSC